MVRVVVQRARGFGGPREAGEGRRGGSKRSRRWKRGKRSKRGAAVSNIVRRLLLWDVWYYTLSMKQPRRRPSHSCVAPRRLSCPHPLAAKRAAGGRAVRRLSLSSLSGTARGRLRDTRGVGEECAEHAGAELRESTSSELGDVRQGEIRSPFPHAKRASGDEGKCCWARQFGVARGRAGIPRGAGLLGLRLKVIKNKTEEKKKEQGGKENEVMAKRGRRVWRERVGGR